MNSIDYSTALSDLHELGSRPDAESGGLDRLVVACHVARDAYEELEWEADHVASGPVKELLRIARDQAWEVWQRMERAGLPLLQEWQRDNGLLAPASDDAECSVCGGRGYDVIGPMHLDCAACHGTGQKPVADADTPHDNDQLGPLIYEAEFQGWRYSASYSDRDLAERRADSLSTAYGVPFTVMREYIDGPDEWFPATDGANTPQLRAAMATPASPTADAKVEF